MQTRKVAIIDDNEDSLRELEQILEMAGYTPVLVNDIFGAVDTVIKNKPDVILMELKMPHKNGFALADAINRVFETKKIPIIAMSNLFKDEFKWLMDFCGIKRWIQKPFLPLDLIWAIENEIEENNQPSMERPLVGAAIMVIMCCVLLSIPVLSFADDQQEVNSNALATERAGEKVTFNDNKALYNDKANKDSRAKESAEKDIKSNDQNNKKVQKEQDAKGNLNEKNEQDGKNEQYDKQASVKF